MRSKSVGAVPVDDDDDDDDVGGRLRDVGVSDPSHDEQPLRPSMK